MLMFQRAQEREGGQRSAKNTCKDQTRLRGGMALVEHARILNGWTAQRVEVSTNEGDAVGELLDVFPTREDAIPVAKLSAAEKTSLKEKRLTSGRAWTGR